MKKLILALAFALLATPAFAQAVPQKYDSASGTNSTLVRAGGVQLNLIAATNSTATVYYLKIYDLAVAPTCGTSVPVLKFAIPVAAAGGQLTVPAANLGGLQFFNGVGFCLTGLIADSDTTTAAAGVTLNFGVKQ